MKKQPSWFKNTKRQNEHMTLETAMWVIVGFVGLSLGVIVYVVMGGGV